MCTVLLRHRPETQLPLLLAAVRDEFVEREFDPPARHWGDGLVGGRDRTAGGTWLAIDPDRRAVAAVLNGARLPLPEDGVRPSRGGLPLGALRTGGLPDLPDLHRYDGFHLVHATTDVVDVWSWDGTALTTQRLSPGDHMIVNQGVDVTDRPVVAHFLPLFEALPDSKPDSADPPYQVWGPWIELLRGDGVDPADPAALIVRRSYADHIYGSTSASLVGLTPAGVRFDFTTRPTDPASWRHIAI